MRMTRKRTTKKKKGGNVGLSMSINNMNIIKEYHTRPRVSSKTAPPPPAPNSLINLLRNDSTINQNIYNNKTMRSYKKEIGALKDIITDEYLKNKPQLNKRELGMTHRKKIEDLIKIARQHINEKYPNIKNIKSRLILKNKGETPEEKEKKYTATINTLKDRLEKFDSMVSNNGSLLYTTIKDNIRELDKAFIGQFNCKLFAETALKIILKIKAYISHIDIMHKNSGTTVDLNTFISNHRFIYAEFSSILLIFYQNIDCNLTSATRNQIKNLI